MTGICAKGTGRNRRKPDIASRGFGRLNRARERIYRGRRTQATSHIADGTFAGPRRLTRRPQASNLRRAT